MKNKDFNELLPQRIEEEKRNLRISNFKKGKSMTVGELKETLKDIPNNLVVVDWHTKYEITDVWVCHTKDYPEIKGQIKYADETPIDGKIFCI